MLELEYKRKVAGALRTMGWKVQEFEDKISNYIPDLGFSAHDKKGWIEVKYVDRMPASGLRSIRHYTKGQEDFLIEHGERGGGLCFLLLGTGMGHYAWSHPSLRNARAGTWVAAQSLCVCRSVSPGTQVLDIATRLNAEVLFHK